MSYRSWVDIVDITYNSTDLKAYVISVSGLKKSSVMQNWHSAGSAFPSADATGMYQQEPVVIEFVYDDGASGPNVKCAQDTSATLTITFVSGQSISGTFIVSEVEVGTSADGDNTLTVTLTPSGTVTWDLAA
jgi:predicted secreted protein